MLASPRRGLLALAAPLLLLGCADDPPPDPPTVTQSPSPTRAPEPRAQLAALAAAAEDRHLVATYTFTQPGRTDRTVSFTSALDGTWRVDIPGGALGGTVDVSIAETRDGVYQCALPSPRRPESATCVRVAGVGRPLPTRLDPRLQHLFTDWRKVLTDRQAPLAVSTSAPIPGTRGDCFTVDSTSASLSPPLDVGIYCYAPDGTLTGVRLASGTLVLVGAPTAAPATVSLPGPVVTSEPLPVTAAPGSGSTGGSADTTGGSDGSTGG